MVCEHVYMNISPPPPNYRACYGPAVSYNNSSLIVLDRQSTSKIAIKHSESYMGQALNSDTDLWNGMYFLHFNGINNV